jgi:ribosomal protein L7/L12
MPAPPGDGPLEEVRRALVGQAKLRAIKLYRQANGTSWAAAAEAVDRIRAGRAPAAVSKAAPPSITAEARAIGEALDAGNLIEAIRLYRAMTGAGLKESKDAIDAILAEKRAGARPRAPSPSVGTHIVERRRLSPVVALLSLAALFGTVFGLIILLAGG